MKNRDFLKGDVSSGKYIRESRIPMGWSVPKSSPKSGPRAKCRGCQKYIGRDEYRVKHRHKEEQNHQYAVVHYFHLQASCLRKVPLKNLKSFLEKKWVQIPVKLVVSELVNSESD